MITRITEISEKFDILLDLKVLKPEKPKKITKERNQFLKKREITTEVCKIFKRRILRFIDLDIGRNAKYTKNQFFNLLIHIASVRDFTENGKTTLEVLKNIVCPDADTHFYHIKKNKNAPQMQQLSSMQRLQLESMRMRKKFAAAFEAIWEMAHQYKHFNERNGVDLAIDTTDWQFFGNKNTDMLVFTKKDDKIIKVFRFATVVIVEPDKRFTLLVLPMGPLDNQHDILRQLLCYAKERVKIKRVYLDKAYFNSPSIKILQELHLKYMTPCTEYSTVKTILGITPATRVVKDFPMKDIIVQHDHSRREK